MCPGLEWWLHKGVLNLRNSISMLKLCLGFLVDTLFCVKWLARLSWSEILVVVILSVSEWWLFCLSGGRSTTVGHIPEDVTRYTCY